MPLTCIESCDQKACSLVVLVSCFDWPGGSHLPSRSCQPLDEVSLISVSCAKKRLHKPFFGSPVYDLDPWLGTWVSSVFQPFPELVSGSLYLNHLCKTLPPCLESRSFICAGRPTPVKTLGAKALMSSPGGSASYVLSHNSLLGEFKHILCDLTGRGLWKLVPGFPQTSFMWLFSWLNMFGLLVLELIIAMSMTVCWVPVNYQTWGLFGVWQHLSITLGWNRNKKAWFVWGKRGVTTL